MPYIVPTAELLGVVLRFPPDYTGYGVEAHCETHYHIDLGDGETFCYGFGIGKRGQLWFGTHIVSYRRGRRAEWENASQHLSGHFIQ